MTDFKPANTLYDPIKRKGVLIDLGGVINVGSREKLQ
jgi:hypothetical protein